jgi:hypothetical protein
VRCGALPLTLLVLGCGPKPSQPHVAPERQDPCHLIASSGRALDTLTVSLLDSVHRDHALAPLNDSELLLYRMTFDTPLRVDCQGRALPGLATSWDRDSTGRIWTLTLKEDVQRYYNTPMSAYDVVAAWNERKAIEGSRALQSAVALDARRISVTLSTPQDSVPKILADPAFSMAIAAAQRPPGVKFEVQAGIDPRDALDRGADLAVTRDPILVEYASQRAEFATFPLPWSRTYVLLDGGTLQDDLVGGLGTASVRRSLADDAVRAGARPAEPPYWWNDLQSCPVGPPGQSGSPRSRIIYRKDDDVARGLAERIVALASSHTLRAVGLEQAEFASAVQDGTDGAYVIGLPRRSLAPCRDASRWAADARLLPLIDTRAYAIVRRGVPPLTVEWDGTVRVAEP